MAFATEAELETYLGASITTDQATLWLALATGAIQGYTGQDLEAVAGDTAILRGNWSDELLLPERPVTAVTSITVDGSLVPAAEYVWTADGVVTRAAPEGVGALLEAQVVNGPARWAGFWGGDGVRVVVVYDHGFSTIPGDIKGVCLALAARIRSTPDGGAIASESLGAYSVTYSRQFAAMLSADEKSALRRYRRRNVTVPTL